MANGNGKATGNKVSEMLDTLEGLQEVRSGLEDEKRRAIAALIVSPEVRRKMAKIEIRYADRMREADKNISTLQSKIKLDVLRLGRSVAGTWPRAVWSNGRISWNDSALLDHAAMHPAVLKWRKVGQPVVSIKVVK